MSLFKKTTDDNDGTPVMGTPDMVERPKASPVRKSAGGSSEERTSIGPGAQLTGRIEINSDKHDLHIDGNFKGEIHSNSAVIIGQNGHVEGDIFGAKLVISGHFSGNADFDRIELIAGGNVDGTLASSQLTIDAVSSFHGQSIAKKRSGENTGKTRETQKPPAEVPKATPIDPIRLTTPKKPSQQGSLADKDIPKR
ncbi:MAG: polymer-forming cytoskeletal protein [Gammaproteobacteria bacterium]|nr:polymer-forming cytoskeletal protein [Gammaproteobacteria bacterium]MCY4228880.1 polymer-forming cytoskeletal protein [Gammaproteobacteria bacterium]